jgi:hypothetical protein
MKGLLSTNAGEAFGKGRTSHYCHAELYGAVHNERRKFSDCAQESQQNKAEIAIKLFARGIFKITPII